MKFNFKQFKKSFISTVLLFSVAFLALNIYTNVNYYSQFTSKEKIEQYFANNEVVPNGTKMLGVGGSTVVFITTVGEGTWTVPAGVESATIECIGGGGGGNFPASGYFNGGGGGAYSKKNSLVLTPGDSVSYNVGIGGTPTNDGENTWFKSTSDVLAVGGHHGRIDASHGDSAGGAAANCVGDVKYSGGNGFGYGGGGAAGLNGNGRTSTSATYDNTDAYGDDGYGGAGGNKAFANGNPGTEWQVSPTRGSGGGGAWDAVGGLYGGGGGGRNGIGAQGIIVITYTPASSGSFNFFLFF